MRFALAASLLLPILCAAPVLAQDEEMAQAAGQQTDGWIRLESDGERHDFMSISFLFDGARVGTSSVADRALTGEETTVSVSGGQTPDGSGPFVHIALGMPDEGEEQRLNPEITWYPNGQEPPFYASLLAKPPEVTISAYHFDGKTGAISGSFTGTVCQVTDWDQDEPDASICREVSGAFETRLNPAF